VALARDGITMTPDAARSLANVLPAMAAYPASVAAFSRTARRTTRARVAAAGPGEHARAHPRGGRDGFYAARRRGCSPRRCERGGGIIALEDLALYQPRERPPLRGTYRGYEVISMPPPSSGGVACCRC
jgi:gamma-glutamyltranspeptidase / glutathione hydrolase